MRVSMNIGRFQRPIDLGCNHRRRLPGLLGQALAVASLTLSAVVAADEGEAVYRFYCYQCHGYAGNAQTLAASYLSPPPRDFTRAGAGQLPEDRIVTTVLMGRPGTAMPAFAKVLADDEVRAVARYVATELVGRTDNGARYHSPENGWRDHDRFASAYPFVEGSVRLDTAWEELTPEQVRGRRLFESACVSCHDQPAAREVAGVDWELRAVSYPREHFSHRAEPPDLVSGASPYARHDLAPDPSLLSAAARDGKTIYDDNCAFCHAADGTGRNWIGSFLEPKPRDFTDPGFRLLTDAAAMEQRILHGIPETSMPAWRDVLSTEEIAAVIQYMQEAFRPGPGD